MLIKITVLNKKSLLKLFIRVTPQPVKHFLEYRPAGIQFAPFKNIETLFTL